MPVLKMTKEQFRTEDEAYWDWWNCPNCLSMDISNHFNFCPSCGYELEWPSEEEVEKIIKEGG